MSRQRGMLIVVLGPDGAGKSTLVQHLLDSMRDVFAQTHCQHVRPRLFGKTDEPMTQPHHRPPHGPVKSLLKLAYLWTDYVAGYWLKTRPLLARRTLCVSDRYYHDVFVDPIRHHIGLGAGLARLLTPSVPSPDLMFVLDAPASLVMSRKSEVSIEECERQLAEYRALAGRYPYVRLLNASNAANDIAARARDLIIQHMTAKDHRCAPLRYPQPGTRIAAPVPQQRTSTERLYETD